MSKILELADDYAEVYSDSYYKAVKKERRAALAAEVELVLEQNKQLREQNDSVGSECARLEAENERLTQQAFTLAVECDELRMELGDLPESQAEMLTTIKELHAENDQIRTLMSIYNLGCWRDSLTLIKERDALRTELEAVRKDAARYRWLRENYKSWSWQPTQYNKEVVSGFAAFNTGYSGFSFENAIDAAMEATK